MYDTYKIHIIQNHTKIKKIKKKHPKKNCISYFFSIFVSEWEFPIKHFSKRRYAHHLVVEKRRKLTHESKKLA